MACWGDDRQAIDTTAGVAKVKLAGWKCKVSKKRERRGEVRDALRQQGDGLFEGTSKVV
jgi:hypothetical protein